MFLSNWRKRLTGLTKNLRRPTTKFRPRLEALEDRAVPAFVPGVDISTGFGPLSVAVGDVNNDGQPDVVVPDLSDARIAIYLNTGSGRFDDSNPITYVAAKHPGTITIADLNGDGNLDIITANTSDTTVSVFLGDGKAGFGRTDYNVGYYNFGVTAADFNGDGKADLAVALPDDGKVALLQNAGNGTFGAPTTYAVGNNARSPAAADFNGDGMLDLVVVNSIPDSISVLLNKGNGMFNPAINLASGGTTPSAVAVGDFNGDGRPDLAVTNSASNSISVFLSTGSGFGSALTFPSGGRAPASLAAADFNADGKLDLAAANGLSDAVSVYNGNGAGGFAISGTYTVGKAPGQLVAADINGDSRPDLIVPNQSGYTISVLIDQADPTLPGSPQAPGGDVTSSLSIHLGKARRNSRTGRYQQVLTVRYAGNQVLHGSLTLVLEQLNRKVRLRKAAGAVMGKTDRGAPSVALTPAGGQLSPGQLLTVTLEFSASSAKRIRYIPRVLVG